MDRETEAHFVTLRWPLGHAVTPSAYQQTRRQLRERLHWNWRGRPWFVIGKLEFHWSGVPHIHLVGWGFDEEALGDWLAAVWPDLTGATTDDDRRSAVWLEPSHDAMVTGLYLSKRDSRGVDAERGNWGNRWWKWGDATPFLSPVLHREIPDRVAVRLQRYMRRVAGVRYFNDRLTVLGEPDLWRRALELELRYHDERESTGPERRRS